MSVSIIFIRTPFFKFYFNNFNTYYALRMLSILLMDSVIVHVFVFFAFPLMIKLEIK